MGIQSNSQEKQTWTAKNKSRKIINIGDLPKIPSFDPGGTHDLLRYYDKETINRSNNLSELMRAGILKLIKKTNETREETFDPISVNSVEASDTYSRSEIISLTESSITGENISSALASSSNSKIVYPGDTLQTVYNWLSSSDRDAQMGALSSTTPRYLLKMPGVTGNVTTMTDHVYIRDIWGSDQLQVASRAEIKNIHYPVYQTSNYNIPFRLNFEDHDDIRYTFSILSILKWSDDTTYVRSGISSMKCTNDTGATSAAWIKINLGEENVLPPFIDVNGGLEGRLRFYCDPITWPSNTVCKLDIGLFNGPYATYNNCRQMTTVAAAGWNDVEFCASMFNTEYGTFDETLPIQTVVIRFGAQAGSPGVIPNGGYIVLDLLEFWQNGLEKGAVILQLDDGLVDNLEMGAYFSRYGFPFHAYVNWNLIGQNIGGGLDYLDWDEIKAVEQMGGLISAHASVNCLTYGSNAAGIDQWCQNSKREFIGHGLTTGIDYMALPAGQQVSMTGEDDFEVFKKYFIHIRGASGPWWQECNAITEGYIGAAQQPFALYNPRKPEWGSSLPITAASYKTLIDSASRFKCIAPMFAHGLTDNGYAWGLTRAEFREIIDYIYEKVEMGELDVITWKDIVE